MSEQFDQLVARYEEFQSKIKRASEQFDNIEQLRTDVSDIEATARSSDQSVTVTAGAGGGVTDIKFTAQALKQQPDELASTVLSTLQQAVADSARQQAGLVDSYMGDQGFDATDRVLETQAELFGTDKEELRSQLAEASPAQAQEHDRYDDYTPFAEQSFLDYSEEPQHHAQPTQQTDEPRSAGEDFLRNLFNDDDEDYR